MTQREHLFGWWLDLSIVSWAQNIYVGPEHRNGPEWSRMILMQYAV